MNCTYSEYEGGGIIIRVIDEKEWQLSNIPAIPKISPMRVYLSDTSDFVLDEELFFLNIMGMIQMNKQSFQIQSIHSNYIVLKSSDATHYSSYISGGRFVRRTGSSYPIVTLEVNSTNTGLVKVDIGENFNNFQNGDIAMLSDCVNVSISGFIGPVKVINGSLFLKF